MKIFILIITIFIFIAITAGTCISCSRYMSKKDNKIDADTVHGIRLRAGIGIMLDSMCMRIVVVLRLSGII